MSVQINFGFYGSKDFVPEPFCSLCKSKKLIIFLTLYNANVDDALKIPMKFAINAENFSEIFSNFIIENLRFKPLNFKKCVKFDVLSNVIILSFLKGKNIKFNAKIPLLKIARLIQILYQNGKFSLFFDANIFFKNFVFDKIAYKNSNREIYLKDEIMVIDKKLAVIVNFKSLDFEKQNFSSDIKKALSNSEILKLESVYLIYPKAQNFRRHILIKSENIPQNLTLKLVPYRINNKICLKG